MSSSSPLNKICFFRRRRACARPPRNSRQGHTLLELLVASTLATAAILTAASFFATFAQQRQNVSVFLDSETDHRLLRQSMEKMVRLAIPDTIWLNDAVFSALGVKNLSVTPGPTTSLLMVTQAGLRMSNQGDLHVENSTHDAALIFVKDRSRETFTLAADTHFQPSDNSGTLTLNETVTGYQKHDVLAIASPGGFEFVKIKKVNGKDIDFTVLDSLPVRFLPAGTSVFTIRVVALALNLTQTAGVVDNHFTIFSIARSGMAEIVNRSRESLSKAELVQAGASVGGSRALLTAVPLQSDYTLRVQWQRPSLSHGQKKPVTATIDLPL